MSTGQRPTGVTILAVLMTVVSLWWLMLALFYFLGGFAWIFWAPWLGFWGWTWGILLGILGLIGLGVAGGLMQGARSAYTFTWIIAVIGLIFSIPEMLSGYGFVGAIIDVVILIYLSRPGVKAFFTQ